MIGIGLMSGTSADSIDAACVVDRENENKNKSNNHNDSLHKVRSTFSKESAEESINNYKNSADYHHRNIGKTENCRKKFSASYEAASCINRKENTSPCAQLKESTDSNPKRGASRLRLLRPHRE